MKLREEEILHTVRDHCCPICRAGLFESPFNNANPGLKVNRTINIIFLCVKMVFIDLYHTAAILSPRRTKSFVLPIQPRTG